MKKKTRCLGLALLGALSCLSLAACDGNEVSPVSTHYAFIARDPDLSPRWLATPPGAAPRSGGSKVTACVTHPAGYTIAFQGSLTREITADGAQTLLFGEGLYPFALTAKDPARPSLCGAMMIVNVDKTVALATFGRSEETKLFSPGFVEKAGKGVFTTYTITFDNRPVIRYWLGNRRHPTPPGHDTVELDFSGTDGIAELRIDGSRVSDLCPSLDIVESSYDLATNIRTTSPRTYKLEIARRNGKRYAGYIRDLKTDAFTTFTQLPCAIPASLFDAADKGTIAKFSVYPESNKTSPVAEIVFGEAK